MVASVTNRTAVYGPVRTVVWQGSVGDRRPYADQIPISLIKRIAVNAEVRDMKVGNHARRASQ
jgi:hypothetical protein